MSAVIGVATNVDVAMCITDFLTGGNPLVYANDAFLNMTGYSREETLGQNCRFLQGEGTSQDEIAKVSAALRRGSDVMVKLANYKKASIYRCIYIYVTGSP